MNFSRASKLFFVLTMLVTSPLSMAFFSLQAPWAAQAELGTIVNSGNSTSKSVNGKFSLEYETTYWYDKAHMETQYGDNEGLRTEERYSFNGETRYRYSKRMYLFAKGEAIKQHFKPYEQVYSESVGLGRRIFDSKKLAIDFQLGPGGRHAVDADGKSIDEFVVDNAINTRWKITKTTAFKHEISTQIGQQNIFSKSVASIETKFIGHLGLKFSYVLEFNSDLPEETNKTHFDSTTSVTMVYDF